MKIAKIQRLGIKKKGRRRIRRNCGYSSPVYVFEQDKREWANKK